MTREVSAWVFDCLKNLDLPRFLSGSKKRKWLALCKNPVSQKVDALYLTCKGKGLMTLGEGGFSPFSPKSRDRLCLKNLSALLG